MTDPVLSAGRLCVQQWLSGRLDGHRFVTTTATVSTFRAMTVPPIPGRQIQEVFSSYKERFIMTVTSAVVYNSVGCNLYNSNRI